MEFEQIQISMTTNSRPRQIPRLPSNLKLDKSSEEHLIKIIRNSINNLGLANNLNKSSILPTPTDINYWSDAIYKIIQDDLLPCFDDETISGLQKTKNTLSKAIHQINQSKNQQPLKHAKSSIFNNHSLPSRAKSPDNLSLSPSILTAALQQQHSSPPDFSLPDPNTIAISRDALKSKTAEIIVQSLQNEQLNPQVNLYAVKFHLRSVKTNSLDNQRKISFEPKKWSYPPPTQPTNNRIRGQTDVVQLFSDPLSLSNLSDLICPDRHDLGDDPLIVPLSDGRQVRVTTILIGGTITLKGPGRELRKLKKVIELAIFAACNLKLEVHLLRDASCFRSLAHDINPSTPTSTSKTSRDNHTPSPTDCNAPHLAFAQDTPPQSTLSTHPIQSTPPARPSLDIPPHSTSSQYSAITADSNWSSPPPPAVSSSFSLPLSSLPISPFKEEEQDVPPAQSRLNASSLHFHPSLLSSPRSSRSTPVIGRPKWSKAGLWGLLLGKPSTCHLATAPESNSPSQPRRSESSCGTEGDGGEEADEDEDYGSQPASPTPRKKYFMRTRASTSSSPRSVKRLTNRIKRKIENSIESSPRRKIAITPGSFFYNTYGRGSVTGVEVGRRRNRRGYSDSDDWELVVGDSRSRGEGGSGKTADCDGSGGGQEDDGCSVDSSSADHQHVNQGKTVEDMSFKPHNHGFVEKLSSTFFKAGRITSTRGTSRQLVSFPTLSSIEGRLLVDHSRNSLTETETEEEEREESECGESIVKPVVGRFESVIEQMKKAILSVSPDVVFPPPHLLVRLRQQEIAEAPGAIIERSMLTPNLSEELHETFHSQGRPHNAFDRQRSFANADAECLSTRFANTSSSSDTTPFHPPPPGSNSSLLLPHQPPQRKITVDARAGLASLMTNNSSLDGTLRHQSIQFLCERSSLFSTAGIAACERPTWKTWRYYQDLLEPASSGLEYTITGTVGQVVGKLIDEREERCNSEGCGKRNGDHVVSLIHHTVRIVVSVEDQLVSLPPSSPPASEEKREEVELLPLHEQEEDIIMWSKCRFCGRCTKPVSCSEATLLFSFAKYLELVLYDGNFIPTTNELCEHGNVRQDALIRFFSKGKARVKLALETVDLFELRLPTAIDQSIRDDGTVSSRQGLEGNLNESIRQLEEEIDQFFRSVYARTSILDETLHKREQRLESAQQRSNTQTPVERADASDPLPVKEEMDKSFANGASSRPKSKAIKATLPDHRGLLANVVRMLEREEVELRAQLPNLNPSQLNSLRKPFVDTILRSKARLLAWEKKYQSVLSFEPAGTRQKLSPPNFVEPIYAMPGNHALPADSSVIIREAEISTIIAFTLSSSSYKRLLASSKEQPSQSSSVNHSRLPSHLLPSSPALNPKRDFSTPRDWLSEAEELPDEPSKKASSLPSPPNNSHTTTTMKTSDPDDERSTFGKDCGFEGHAKLKKPFKQAPSTILLRALSKQRSFDTGAFRAFGGGPSRVSTPAKVPAQDPFIDAVLAQSAAEAEGGDDRILDDLIKSSETSTLSFSGAARSTSVAPGPVAALLSRGAKAEASISHADTRGDLGKGASAFPQRAISLESSIEDLPKTEAIQAHEKEDSQEVISDQAQMALSDTQKPPPASRLFTKTIGGSNQTRPAPQSSSILTAPLQAIWTLGGSIKMKSDHVTKDLGLDDGPPESSAAATAATAASSSPHIKYKFRHGTKEFSCTVWHADSFNSIRERCGVSESFLIGSLSRCNNWAASGGKSKSNFFLTLDQRFILKGMITSWNMSEREALLNFAPNYFDYLSSSTSTKPSVMCKILGFFTVKIKEAGKNENEVKLDLLLMENLFHGQVITRKFDLKGITTRVAKVRTTSKDGDKEKNGTTGWDADWIEGSLRTLLLIHPHSKHVISSAVENDTKFLAECNIMDYSLLVGVDDTRKELVIGMIDVIGTFNLAKMLESRGKMVLKSSDKKGEVTILPPIEYAARFRKAMETYFVAVPEKWSRPLETQTDREREWQEDPSLTSVF